MSKHFKKDVELEEGEIDEEEEEEEDVDEPVISKSSIAAKTAAKKAIANASHLNDDDESDEDADVSSDEDGSNNDDGSDDDGSDDGEPNENDDGLPSSRETGIPDVLSYQRAALDLGSDNENSSDEDEDEDEHYLQKFDESLKTNIIAEYHPEMLAHNYDEVDILTRIVRNEHGLIIDPLHKTLPFLTKYERARILGERAKQLNSGAKAFVEVDPSVIDGYLIALAEFEQKKIPFIVKRPMPNGGCEYWKLRDLEVL